MIKMMDKRECAMTRNAILQKTNVLKKLESLPLQLTSVSLGKRRNSMETKIISFAKTESYRVHAIAYRIAKCSSMAKNLFYLEIIERILI
jgi:hypothetical protein